jgi:hypothetical protein
MTDRNHESGVYDSDFFEEDEPVEKIKAILETGFDGITAPPGEAIEPLTMELDVSSIVVQGGYFQSGHFEDRRPVEMKRPSVTIRP